MGITHNRRFAPLTTDQRKAGLNVREYAQPRVGKIGQHKAIQM